VRIIPPENDWLDENVTVVALFVIDAVTPLTGTPEDMNAVAVVFVVPWNAGEIVNEVPVPPLATRYACSELPSCSHVPLGIVWLVENVIDVLPFVTDTVPGCDVWYASFAMLP
jgi:hypothetical protein